MWCCMVLSPRAAERSGRDHRLQLHCRHLHHLMGESGLPYCGKADAESALCGAPVTHLLRAALRVQKNPNFPCF
jgi:hypothetical protein